jgi:hypothetical protein
VDNPSFTLDNSNTRRSVKRGVADEPQAGPASTVVSADPAAETGDTMADKPGSVSFEATITATGNNTGIVVPDEVLERLGAGRRPPLLVSLNGYEYRTTPGVMNGRSMVSVSAAVRAATGLAGGAAVHVTLTVADSPREVTIPDDFAAALAADEQAAAFFGKLSNSLQRYHVDSITSAKSPDTRQRRIDKALALFRDGKQR